MTRSVITVLAATIAATIASYLITHAQEGLSAFYPLQPAATLPLAGTEYLLVIQNGALKQVPVAQFQTTIRVCSSGLAVGVATWTTTSPPTLCSGPGNYLLAQ